MQMSHRQRRGGRLPRTAAWQARRPLRLLVALLLLELPELGLDGDRRLLGLGVLHVDVEVLRDVRLGRVWKGEKKGQTLVRCTAA